MMKYWNIHIIYTANLGLEMFHFRLGRGVECFRGDTKGVRERSEGGAGDHQGSTGDQRSSVGASTITILYVQSNTSKGSSSRSNSYMASTE